MADRVYEKAVEGVEDADRAAMVRALARITANLEDTRTKTKDKAA